MANADSTQADRDATTAVLLVADMFDVGVDLYRQRMIRERGAERAEEAVQLWLSAYQPPADWRLAKRAWAAR